MKKILGVFALLLTCVLTLVSCGGNKENLIVVGTMAQPGEPILESIREALKEEGYELKIQLYSHCSPYMSILHLFIIFKINGCSRSSSYI